MNDRDQIAKRMMFAVANLINNTDDERLPELTTEYWEASVAFHDEFAHEPTSARLAAAEIEAIKKLLNP